MTDQFDTTRRLLNAEVLDLYQAHAVTSLAELDRRSAALERIVALRDAGHTRFAGITGHDLEVPRSHLEALRRFDLDTVMFPVYPGAVGPARVPGAGRGAARPLRRARHRGHGHQGRGLATLGRRP